jgi:hypothetical protein
MYYYMRTKLLDGEGYVFLVKAIASLTPFKMQMMIGTTRSITKTVSLIA